MAQTPCPHCNGTGSIAGPLTLDEALAIAKLAADRIRPLGYVHLVVGVSFKSSGADGVPGPAEYQVGVLDNAGVRVAELASEADAAALPESIPGYIAPASEQG